MLPRVPEKPEFWRGSVGKTSWAWTWAWLYLYPLPWKQRLKQDFPCRCNDIWFGHDLCASSKTGLYLGVMEIQRTSSAGHALYVRIKCNILIRCQPDSPSPKEPSSKLAMVAQIDVVHRINNMNMLSSLPLPHSAQNKTATRLLHGIISQRDQPVTQWYTDNIGILPPTDHGEGRAFSSGRKTCVHYYTWILKMILLATLSLEL